MSVDERILKFEELNQLTEDGKCVNNCIGERVDLESFNDIWECVDASLDYFFDRKRMWEAMGGAIPSGEPNLANYDVIK